jgi:hypothetical protein
VTGSFTKSRYQTRANHVYVLSDRDAAVTQHRSLRLGTARAKIFEREMTAIQMQLLPPPIPLPPHLPRSITVRPTSKLVDFKFVKNNCAQELTIER